MLRIVLLIVSIFVATTALAVDLGGFKEIGKQATQATKASALETMTQKLKKVQNEKGPILFQKGKAVVDPVCDPTMQKIADILAEFPGFHVQVDGHTDNVGKPESNQKLSQERAAAVVDYLVAKKGVKAKRLSAKGWGDTSPIADNKSESGRAKNRRVDFTVTAL